MPKTSTSWKPGQSGNPAGRPRKGDSLAGLMRQYLEHIPEGHEKPYKELFVRRVFQLAMEGSVPAIKLIWNQVDGKPKEYKEMEGNITNHLSVHQAIDLLEERTTIAD